MYTSAQVRELDRIAIEERGIASYALMQRAAQAAFKLIQSHWLSIKQLCIVCGAGNNAGDGYVLARLALQKGWEVTVVTVVAPDKLKGDAAVAFQDYQAAGGQFRPFADRHRVVNCGLMVDALLGTGLQRDVAGEFADAVQWMNQSPAPCLSLDMPSGLDADTGQARGCAVVASATITFIGLKQGLLTGKARAYCGALSLDTLNIPDLVFAQQSCNQYTLGTTYLKHWLSPRPACAHKGHFGHALLIGGTEGMSGAIRLAGEAALRSGSGLVTVVTHPAHAAWLNLNRPELMVSAVQTASQLHSKLKNKSTIGIGPGLGQDDWAQQLFLVACNSEQPMVVDADALNLLSRLNRKQNNWVLTPHPAEAARLLGCSTADIEVDRVGAVKKLQQNYGGVCVLKGAGTLVCSDKNIAFCTAGNPGMASGGMGDVLTGIITALLAQGLNLFDAACAGVQVHAMAADVAAEEGTRGMLASDVITQLRKVVNP